MSRADVVLPDGARLRIRPVKPGDRQLVAVGVERLSPESRYRRFFSPVPDLSRHDLDYLTRVDHREHEALLAIDAATGDCVGVARFVRVGEGTAMPALAVIDPWQRRGVGTRLLDRLVERAREEGYTHFRADLMADNVEAIRLFKRLGEATARTSRGLTTLEVALAPADDERAPQGLRALLAGAGAGHIAPARTLWHRVAGRSLHGRSEPQAGARAGAPIVVGTDGSRVAAAAVLSASQLTRVLGSPLHIVSARRLHASRRSQSDVLERAAAAVRGDGLSLELHATVGDPAQALLDVADEVSARLIVVGSPGPASSTADHLGGVGVAVARDAPCDVLIVRPTQAARPRSRAR